MLTRLVASLCALALTTAVAVAQNRVRTETILPQQVTPAAPPAQQQAAPQPPPAPTPAPPQQAAPTPAPAEQQATPPRQTTPVITIRPVQAPPSALAQPSTAPEIIYDLSRLPAPVARMRERMLAAARSGDIEQLAAIMRTGAMPVFTFGEEKNPLSYWRTNYPDSSGVEVLSILLNVLQAGFVVIDKGTPREMYIWPYFAFTPLATLTPQQKVELFRIVTGSDFKEMSEFGAYIFYRVGIAPDGTWNFFVSGD